MKKGRFDGIFLLIKEKFHDPESIIKKINEAREMVEEVEEKGRESVLVEMQKNQKLMKLMTEGPRGHGVRMNVVDLLIKEVLEGNWNAKKKHSPDGDSE